MGTNGDDTREAKVEPKRKEGRGGQRGRGDPGFGKGFRQVGFQGEESPRVGEGLAGRIPQGRGESDGDFKGWVSGREGGGGGGVQGEGGEGVRLARGVRGG